jgi:bacillithiol system protein YtxJ
VKQLKSLHQLADLETALSASTDRPLVLFKHSVSCGRSHAALRELHAHLGAAADGADYALITVQSERHLSDEAAARLGIRHETPQIIVVRDGRAVWNASHYRITADAIACAVTAGRHES